MATVCARSRTASSSRHPALVVPRARIATRDRGDVVVRYQSSRIDVEKRGGGLGGGRDGTEYPLLLL